MKWAGKWPVVASVVLLLLSAVSGEPHGLNVLVRLVVCASALYLAVAALRAKTVAWVLVMIGLAVLFNPIMPLRMPSVPWVFFDLNGAALLATPLLGCFRDPGRPSFPDWFSFRGRISRHTFWLDELLPLLCLVAFAKFAMAGKSHVPPSYTAPLAATGVVSFLVWATVATQVRRLHDHGKSGWWIFLHLTAVMSRRISACCTSTPWWRVILLLGAVGPLYLLFHLGFLKGEVGENRFGPDPLVRQVASDATSPGSAVGSGLEQV